MIINETIIVCFDYMDPVDYAVRKDDVVLVGKLVYGAIEDPDTQVTALQTVDCFDYYDIQEGKVKGIFTKAFAEAEVLINKREFHLAWPWK
jgi:hypothetical protein